MATLEDLLAQQDYVMNKISRALPNFKKLGQSKWTLSVIKQRITALQNAFASSEELDLAIQREATDEQRTTMKYFETQQFYQCEDVYNETMDFMAEALGNFESTPVATNYQAHPIIRSGTLSHLPKIHLPTFDGTLTAWESFRDQFTSLIHNSATLSACEKMHFLKSSLKGDALRLLSHLTITEANYNIAWNILNTRFENKRRLIAEHLHSLVNLSLLKTENLNGLRELRDTVNASLQALRNLNRPVDLWPDMVIYIIVNKFDPTTFRAWETRLRDVTEYPTYDDMDQFLESRIQILEAISSRNPSREIPGSTEFTRNARFSRVAAHHTSTHKPDQRKNYQSRPSSSKPSRVKCAICGNEHSVHRCSDFLAFSITQRLDAVNKHSLCSNCLSSSHFKKNCPSIFQCRLCKLRHHTLLHDNDNTSSFKASTADQKNTTTVISANTVAPITQLLAPVILATARVRVCSPSGRWAIIRALLDQGSAATLLSERLAQSLKLQRQRCSLRITGINGVEATARHTASISITPIKTFDPTYNVDAVILSSLTRYAPERIRCSTQWRHTRHIPLAEPDPFSADPIDLVIGADLYGQVLRDGIRSGTSHEPIAQNTAFGWILSGIVSTNIDSTTIASHTVTLLDDLNNQLRQFWELEDLPAASKLTPDEQECENYFNSTHRRNDNGQYIVRLPFAGNKPPHLGSSRERAISSLLSLERRLVKNPTMKSSYHEFMLEYEALGHMRPVPSDSKPPSTSYYIPHHAVLRPGSATSQLRVVFNASATTTNGKSLNDCLAIGPKLQTDLSAIILRWRQLEFVLTADIAKMYRQIWMDQTDVNYQRILWRHSPTDPIVDYQLNTVTYGTASAPFLALRVLQQLTRDEGNDFPLAVSVIQNQTYVDDCIFGAEDYRSALETRDQLISLLTKGGFRLRKWASNHSQLLRDIDPIDHGLALSKDFNSEESLQVLGLSWQPGLDALKFKLLLSIDSGRTKRRILSTISQFFDPLGWLSPVIITAKVFIQKLWSLKCGWDEEIPEFIQHDWNQFYTELCYLEQVTIPRWTGFSHKLELYELHGFADASTTAFAAAIYARHVKGDGTISTTLLIAKSKVAPLKSVSVPRLELCAAQLLARLVDYVLTTLPNQPKAICCWTDSTIVLAWLRQPPSRWKTFVANRVSSIQQLTSTAVWRYVSTSDNPADCASRGIFPSKIRHHPLWWSGPDWLRQPIIDIPRQELSDDSEVSLEARHVAICHSTVQPIWELQTRFSTWPKLLRVTALVFKFITRIQIKKMPSAEYLCPDDASTASRINYSNLQKAKRHWLQVIQRDAFSTELRMITAQGTVTSSNRLASLNPYIDSAGLLRVGGRLRHASYDHSRKHPIILQSHQLVNLIIRHHHLMTLHGGAQLTLSSLRSEYWLIRARPTIRSVIHRCLPCVRERAVVPSELMADLPSIRVNRTIRAFIHTGVDYAGPILVRTTPGRGHKTQKAYISIFICMTIKAVHLELVSDYSSAAFLASYHRFTSRRGLPSAMYSDNGTTFQGANKELQTSYTKACRDSNFLNHIAINGVKWHFLPPASPHFGGLWEAGVKSVKYHLRRCIGNQTLTFEEMTTLLCRIEACLNSRPLAPLSDCYEDYCALTPGHFLIGTPLLVSPECSLLHVNENRLNRWQLLQHTMESFWKSWSSDYVQLLQQRPKWRSIQQLAKVGRLVLLRNTNIPPSCWELGRIIECHPGQDGLTRVVTVKTSKSEYVRPLVKLCFLPVDINENEQTQLSTAGGDNSESLIVSEG